ncbi:MAG: heme peroxidase family protein [Bryobacteraceae bacterium]
MPTHAAAAAAAALKPSAKHHGLHPNKEAMPLCHQGVQRADRFGRLFPHLPALYTAPDALAALGASGGPMESTGTPKKAATVSAAAVFFGQFIDHDITLDITSSLTRVNTPGSVANARTPTLDLDCIFGDGPEANPFLYWNGRSGADAALNGVCLLTGADGAAANPLASADLARTADGRACIGDPRNDENRVVSQLQLAMIRFYNKVAVKVHTANPGLTGGALFEEARRVCTWHYQWVVVHDFLTTMIGKPLVDDILGCGRQFYRPEKCTHGEHYGAEPYIPIEFSVAAYRFGHSMVPESLKVQGSGVPLSLFGPELGGGFQPLSSADAVIEWPQVLAERADKLDAKLAPTLLALPFLTAGENSLASRNLLRGQSFLLPSGEKVAAHLCRPEAEIAKVTKAAKILAGGIDLSTGTPLWLYILLEGGLFGKSPYGPADKGEGLGPVGGRIVGEVIIGALELDDRSFLGANRAWHPDDPRDGLGVHTLADMLTYN